MSSVCSDPKFESLSFLTKSDEYKLARCRHFAQSDISKEQRVGYD
jgi:hypothetical protein